jgi:DNA-directed RNA polymerase specialized sigma subunit
MEVPGFVKNADELAASININAAAMFSPWQNREVAAELHVNESRVSQIKQRAISKLRLQLEPGSSQRAA